MNAKHLKISDLSKLTPDYSESLFGHQVTKMSGYASGMNFEVYYVAGPHISFAHLYDTLEEAVAYICIARKF